MIRLSTLLSRSAAAVLLGSLLVLAGCHRGATKDEAVQTAQMQGKFDATVEAYKSGQFMVDGAVLSASTPAATSPTSRTRASCPRPCC